MKCLFNADMADNSVALFSIISILLASLGNVQADLDGSGFFLFSTNLIRGNRNELFKTAPKT